MKASLLPYEPWFKAWLILLPVVTYGSHYIIFNARLRVAQLAKDSLDVPDPQGTWGYAAASGVAFTLLMLVSSKVWVQTTGHEGTN